MRRACHRIRVLQPRYIESSYLSIMRVLDGLVECARSQVMLLPRDGDSAVERGRRGGPDVLVRFGEGGRLHAGVVEVDVGPTCQRVGGEGKVMVGQDVCDACDGPCADQLPLGHQTRGEPCFMRPPISTPAPRDCLDSRTAN